MSETKYTPTFILGIIGSILILLNGALIVVNNSPVILSSFSVASVDEVMNAKTFWGRIVFGVPTLVENYLALFWLIFAVATLICTFLIYRRPKGYQQYSFGITLFSLMCIPIGGGFYLGTILGFIGGVSGMEGRKPFKETFLGRIISGVTLDSKMYTVIRDNPTILRTAALVVIFVGILRGIGSGLYAYNVDIIKRGGAPASQILLNGQVMWHGTAVITAASLIGFTVLEWLILSLVIYWIGVKLTGITLEYDKIVRVLAFAFVPLSLQVFAPLVFSNEPTLSFHWPVGLYLISRLWVFIALVAATAQTFDFTRRRALGVVILGGMMYWIIDNMILIPTLRLPGILITVSAESAPFILLSFSAATIIATLFGVFTKK